MALFDIIRQSQDTSHAETKKLLHLGKKQLIKSLGLFIDQHDIIRCRGRLANCNDLSLDEKKPIQLTQDHLAKLIVEDCHKRTLHSRTRATLIHLRTQFCIPRGRSFTQKILGNCKTCRRMAAKVSYPDQPALPSYRINSAPPFSAVGIDYTGHLFVKSNNAEQSKTNIAVFACCITRAVHLELVTDLTAEQFLLAFRRFCAGKSVPTAVVSDKATHFIAGELAIQAILEDDAIQQHFSKHQIKWIHIPGRSPAWGGWYERLVGIVKNIMMKFLGKALLTQTELHTILIEIEATVNNRLLTYVESDTTPTSPTASTPSHLMNGRILSTLFHLEEPEDNIIQKDLGHLQANQRRFYLTQLQQSIWNRWKTEYLSFLREHQEAKKNGRHLK